MTPYLIPDDPIVRSMERTGRPPWENTGIRVWNAFGGYATEDDFYEEDDEWEEEEADVFYGNESESF